MQFEVKTNTQTEMIDITTQVRKAVDAHGVMNGICMVFVPHTTAAVTINESADPTVRQDILMVINEMVPWKAPYRHMEGNSPAHVKTSLMGSSELIEINDGRLVLGTWQGIFFCEFDGPRTRKVNVTVVANQS